MERPHQHARVLVVNHSGDVALLLKLAVQDAFPDAVVSAVTSAAEAQRHLLAMRPDLLIAAVDDRLGEVRQLVAGVRSLGGSPPKLLIAGNRPDMPVLAQELGAFAWMRRPAPRTQLEATIRQALSETEPAASREEVRPPGVEHLPGTDR